jgi:RNA polymerase sigma-70 factor, ECF subfamily
MDPEDQTLLILRVDRGLTWRELALTMSGDSALDAVALEHEVARLRKAFERIKTELKRWAAKEGCSSVTSEQHGIWLAYWCDRTREDR